ncbi:MAG: hypothetical protein QOC81_930 [Thermoanaerobaculia bacterium]|nr:hypothetical protein [Thermoanaerobaculia bacterium]
MTKATTRFIPLSVARLLQKNAAENHTMAERKEPQSYGSQGDWLTGRTGQKIEGEKGGFLNEHQDESAPHQGGDISPVQASEHAMPSGPPTDTVHKMSTDESGAKRGGYFKERDYDSKK